MKPVEKPWRFESCGWEHHASRGKDRASPPFAARHAVCGGRTALAWTISTYGFPTWRRAHRCCPMRNPSRLHPRDGKPSRVAIGPRCVRRRPVACWRCSRHCRPRRTSQWGATAPMDPAATARCSGSSWSRPVQPCCRPPVGLLLASPEVELKNRHQH